MCALHRKSHLERGRLKRGVGDLAIPPRSLCAFTGMHGFGREGQPADELGFLWECMCTRRGAENTRVCEAHRRLLRGNRPMLDTRCKREYFLPSEESLFNTLVVTDFEVQPEGTTFLPWWKRIPLVKINRSTEVIRQAQRLRRVARAPQPRDGARLSREIHTLTCFDVKSMESHNLTR